jgi:hypothetical protein
MDDARLAPLAYVPPQARGGGMPGWVWPFLVLIAVLLVWAYRRGRGSRDD